MMVLPARARAAVCRRETRRHRVARRASSSPTTTGNEQSRLRGVFTLAWPQVAEALPPFNPSVYLAWPQVAEALLPFNPSINLAWPQVAEALPPFNPSINLAWPQVAEALPPAALLGRAFAAYPRAGAAVLDAACALAGVAFAFVVMPAGDVLLGRDLQGSVSSVRARGRAGSQALTQLFFDHFQVTWRGRPPPKQYMQMSLPCGAKSPGVEVQGAGRRQGIGWSHICAPCPARAGGGRTVSRGVFRCLAVPRARRQAAAARRARTPVHCVPSQPAVGRWSGPGLFRCAGRRRRPGGHINIRVPCAVAASGGQTVRPWPLPMRRRAAAARRARTARCCMRSRRCIGRCCWRAARRRRTCTRSRCLVRGRTDCQEIGQWVQNLAVPKHKLCQALMKALMNVLRLACTGLLARA